MMFELRDGAVRLGTWLVFERLSLKVESGEIISILGPSGCGKTTLLRACSGLEHLESGERHLNGDVLGNQSIVPEITLLFQQPVLYPHLNVAQNIALGAPKEQSKSETRQQVNDVLNTIGLAGFNGRGVAGLSGGEAQRVAFGRALLQEPNVMMLDEPFASVDIKRRLELATMTRAHLKARGMTALHVTHDEEEASILSDRIIHWKELVSETAEDGHDGRE